MPADEHALRNLLARWHALTAAGDVDGVLALMTEDVVFLVAGQAQPMRGRAAFGAGLRQLLQTHRFDTRGEIQEVLVSGDLASCHSLLDVKLFARDSGQLVRHQHGHTLSVFRRDADGQWRLARDANLLMPAGSQSQA